MSDRSVGSDQRCASEICRSVAPDKTVEERSFKLDEDRSGGAMRPEEPSFKLNEDRSGGAMSRIGPEVREKDLSECRTG